MSSWLEAHFCRYQSRTIFAILSPDLRGLRRPGRPAYALRYHAQSPVPQAPPQQLLYLLVGGQAQALLTVEYPSVRLRRPDLVVRLTDGRLFHLELQSDNDATMPWRMLDYYSLLRQHYGQAPHQQVLYVGEAPMTLKARIEESRLTFDYEVRDICTLDGASLLASPVLEDNLLAVWSRGYTPNDPTYSHPHWRIASQRSPHGCARDAPHMSRAETHTAHRKGGGDTDGTYAGYPHQSVLT